LRGIVLTDPAFADRGKQHALVIAGRHGNEESGRMIAMALADWLVGRAGRAILGRQVVAILPDVNPDACLRDAYRHPSGPDVGGDLDEPEPLAESRFIDGVAQRLQPELLIDLHAMGHVGCTYDMTLYPEPRPYTEDDNLFHHVAAAMCAAGEGAGIPHLSHPMAWWDRIDTGVCARYYRQMKSLAMLTETAESNGPVHAQGLRIRSGLARIRAALRFGMRRHPKLPVAGYPNMLAIGGYHLGILAVGRDAAERRASRMAIWRNADHFAKIAPRDLPEEDRIKRIRIDYRGEPIALPIGVQVQVRHHAPPTRVRLGGTVVDRSDSHGFTHWRNGRTAFVAVVIPALRKGVHDVELEFGR
jgi:hypothetical protein